MAETPSAIHADFTFGTNGYFFDDLGHPCVLLGVVEFAEFCHQLDAKFVSPLGRKLIYAATDAEERILQQSNLQAGRWFGKRKVMKKLQQRAASMGWGVFHDRIITNPAHDGLTVGFSLAHHEHVSKRRAHVDWEQISPDMIRLAFAPKDDVMAAPPEPTDVNWFGSGPNTAVVERLDLELDIRHSMFFNAEERSVFIPVHVFHHLFSNLLGRPLSDEQTSTLAINHHAETEHQQALGCIIRSAHAAFATSERAVYLQSSGDWEGHLQARFVERGLGKITVEQSILDNQSASVFKVHSPIAPYACGLLVGMWERAHGQRAVVHVEEERESLRIRMAPPQVNYTD